MRGSAKMRMVYLPYLNFRVKAVGWWKISPGFACEEEVSKR
jgi:hypothetical protein